MDEFSELLAIAALWLLGVIAAVSLTVAVMMVMFWLITMLAGVLF